MRVLVSSVCNFWISRAAVERARELDAPWAFPDHMPLVGEPEHRSARIERDRWEDRYALPSTVPRHDPVLLQVFDELGNEKMVGQSSMGDDEIFCLEIPDDVTYYVGSYCAEWISEQHREWHAGNDGMTRGDWPAFSRESRFVSEGPGPRSLDRG